MAHNANWGSSDGFETNFDFDEACIELSALGLQFPETPASQQIVGSGGERCKSLHGISLEQLFDAVQTVQRTNREAATDTTTQTGSVGNEAAATAVRSGSKATTTAKDLSSTEHRGLGADSVFFSTTAADTVNISGTEALTALKSSHSPSTNAADVASKGTVPVVRREKSSKGKKSDKVTSYFSEVPSQSVHRKGKLDSVCAQCDYVVSSTDNRYKLFHVILCSKIPFSVRLGIYFTSNDKEKPPLIEAPPHHCEPHQARIIIQNQTKSLKELIEGYLSRGDDLSRDQALARWMMAKAEIKMNRRIDYCTTDESRVLSSLLMDFIVEENIPFAVCGNRDYAPRPFGRLLNYARPGYKLPAASKVAGEMLTNYYHVVKQEIQRRLKNMIPDQCRVTIMFDGSEDVKSQPLINVLMRMMGRSRGSVKTYFLKSVYTGYDTCDASYYVQMVENVIQEFGGFESVAGFVTDNTSSVLKAREILEAKYSRLVASQDQAHVADLLMADIGEIPWIRDTLQSISSIGTYLRRFRKLRAKLVERMEKHNEEVRKILAALRGDVPQRRSETRTEDDSMAIEDSQYDVDDPEGEDIGLDESEDDGSNVTDDRMSVGETYSSADESGEPKRPRLVTVRNILSSQIPSAIRELGVSLNEEEEIVSASADQLSLNPEAALNSCAGDVPRFARLMKKVSAVRFASLEKLLYEYKSLRTLLLELVSEVGFESLCGCKTEREKAELERNFTILIKDDQLFQRVVQFHAIMKACRLYLRMFDSESYLISEVVRATSMLEQTFRGLPPECFPEPYQEHQQDLLEVFRNRKEGPIPGRKRVKITLISDLHVAAALLDPYRCPFDISSHKIRLREHLERYLSGSGTIEFRNELEKDEFIVEMMSHYDTVHTLWKAKGYVRADSERMSVAERREALGLSSLRTLRERSPISWWATGCVRLPREAFAKRAAKALVEFAIRTLSVSPTATATERTFSHLSRIQPKQRAGLSREKVEMLLFCQWNLRVLRKVANPYEIDVETEAKKQNVAINQLRAHRKYVTTMSFLGSLRSNAHPAQPVVTEPVTAQNRPQVAGTNDAILRSTGEEGDTVHPTTKAFGQMKNDTSAAIEAEGSFQQQLARLSKPMEPLMDAPYDIRKVRDGGGGPKMVPLQEMLHAAVGVGYTCAIRERGERKVEVRTGVMLEGESGAPDLQNTRNTQATVNITEGKTPGNRSEAYTEKDGANITDEIGSTKRLDDRAKAGLRNRKRRKMHRSKE